MLSEVCANSCVCLVPFGLHSKPLKGLQDPHFLGNRLREGKSLAQGGPAGERWGGDA